MNTNQPAERQNSQITPFTYGDHAVRTVLIDDEPWFIAKDVCDVLGIQNHRDTLAKQVPEDEKGVDSIYSPGGKQEMIIINEPGLYRLIFQSRKPEAEAFKSWVFGEVLPKIRRTGAYAPPGSFLTDEIFRVFIAEEDFGPQRILRLLDLATAKSAITGEYIKAIDVAKALTWGLKNRPTKSQLSHMAQKVGRIRAILRESGAPLPRFHYAIGSYREALPDRPGFPLALPAKGASDARA